MILCRMLLDRLRRGHEWKTKSGGVYYGLGLDITSKRDGTALLTAINQSADITGYHNSMPSKFHHSRSSGYCVHDDVKSSRSILLSTNALGL
jgi:hypothetical protein